MHRKISWMVLASALCFGMSCSAQMAGSWRYKLTLVVDDNGKRYSGSSVSEIREIDVSMIPVPGAPTDLKFTGEAVAVDIDGKGTLFALLGSDGGANDPEHLVCDVFPLPDMSPCAESRTPKAISYYAHLKGKADVPFEHLPMLVRFRDINDPKTVEKLDPNDLAKSFGPGVKLVSATLEMTDEPVTKKVNKVLPSWQGTNFNQWQASLPYGDPLKFDRSNFERNF